MKIIRMILVYLASMVLSKELAALERYRLSIQQADQWLASHPEYVELLKWLKGEGEGTDALHIGKLRADLVARQENHFEQLLQKYLDGYLRADGSRQYVPPMVRERLEQFMAGGPVIDLSKGSSAHLEAVGERMRTGLHLAQLRIPLPGEPGAEPTSEVSA